MSYRELRNFSEYMKTLGYHRIVSLENFRTPNFPLVADALLWLCERYDPGAEIPDVIQTEKERVEFLKATARTMAAKARIKLNIKALYRADGYAVRELLKIASVLHKSLRTSDPGQDGESSGGAVSAGDLQTKIDELAAARDMATEIVESGAKLYGLLGEESELKRVRERAMRFVDSISMNLESNAARETIERSIREQVNSITENVSQLDKMCADLAKDQTSLQSKIERKQMELKRAEQRYQHLKKVRPAHIDDYERMETELKMVYDNYLERFRNLSYLEAQLEKYQEAEREKQRESDRVMRRMQRRMRDEELRVLDGREGLSDDDDDGFDQDEDDIADMRRGRNLQRPKGAGRRSLQGVGMAKVVGSMDGGSSEDSDESSDDSAGGGSRGSQGMSRSDISGESGDSQFDDEDDDERLSDEDEDFGEDEDEFDDDGEDDGDGSRSRSLGDF